jgi:deazaflavin-dependent oxidoreductase (nitroreductase family)
MMLLTTIGSSTGREHTVPLLYLEHDGALVVVASYGGRPDHPQWFKNLLINPQVRAQLGTESFRVDARVASPEERAHHWPRVVAPYVGYRVYQSRTHRQKTQVILDPK